MRVLHIIPYRLQDVLDKGEVTPRYFNPCNIADHITFATWRGAPRDMDALQVMCGTATVDIWNWTPSAALTSCVIPCTQELQAGRAVDLIRAATRIDGIIATKSGTPSLISVHADRLRCLDEVPWWSRPIFWAEGMWQRDTCRRATKVVITSEGYRHIAPDAEYIPNVVGPPVNSPSQNNLVFVVSRRIKGKGFEPMLSAARRLGLPSSHIGDNVTHNNETIRRMMNGARVIALRNHYPGCPKTVQEALLSGTPLVMNVEARTLAPELVGLPIYWCADSVEGYAVAIERVWKFGSRPIDQELADATWNPARTEEQWARAYEETAR